MASSGSFHSTIENGHYWLEVDWTASQNVSNNTSTITATIYLWNDYRLNIGSKTGSITINGRSSNFTTPAINSTGWHTLYKVTSLPISHNSDGTKSVNISCTFNIQATISGHYYSSMTTSANVTLNTIPRASSISSISGNTIGSKVSINISRASSSFTHKVYYTFGQTNNHLVANNVGTSCSFTPAMSDCSYIPNATSGTATIRVDTYSGSTKIGSASKSFTLNVPASVKPTLNDFQITLDNSSNSVIDDWGIAVVGYTEVHFGGTAVGSYGSIIKKYQISGAYNGLLIGDVLNVNSPVLSQSGTLTYNCKAIDSRNRSSNEKSQTITAHSYDRPIINYITSGRDATDNRKVNIEYEYSYSSVDNHNTITPRLFYKKIGDISWNEYTLSATESSIIVNDRVTKTCSFKMDTSFDEAASYNFRLQVTDALGEKAEAESIISTIEVLLDFRAGGKGLGIGKIAESDSLEINLPVKFYKPIYGFTPIVIDTGSDLDDYVSCGYFSGLNENTLNSPTNFNGSYVLEVIDIDGSGKQILQYFTIILDDGIKCYGRMKKADNMWTDWVITYNTTSNVLWTGSLRMTEETTIDLPEAITTQQHGIILEWKLSSSASAEPYGDTSYQFIHKNTGGSHVHQSGTVIFSTLSAKRIQIVNQNTLQGSEYNDDAGETGSGIPYANNRMVLTSVYGW